MPLHRGVGVEGHMLLSRSFVCLKKHTQHCIYWEIEGTLLCCFRIESPQTLFDGGYLCISHIMRREIRTGAQKHLFIKTRLGY